MMGGRAPFGGRSPLLSLMPIDLLVPRLLLPDDAPREMRALRMPALEKWLARSDRSRIDVRGAVPWLARQYALRGALPVAAIAFAGEGGAREGAWLRADPVHLQPERDRLILSDNYVLQLTPDEADQLVVEIMETYGADGWVLKAARPGRWYLKPPRASRIVTTPLAQVVGRDIHPYLPQGKDGKAWHTVLNEIQILLHTAKVNAAREARGQLPVNSLWFWGSGRLPTFPPLDWAHVWSQEPASLALARLSQTPASGVPENFAEWSRQARAHGKHLVVLDQARAPVSYGEESRWREFIQQFERDWIAPLWQAVKGGAVGRVELYDDTGRGFRLTARYARRWWRRRRPLARA